MSRIAGRLARVEPRRRAGRLVLGLLSDLPRLNCWTIAEWAGERTPDGMQHLLNGQCSTTSTTSPRTQRLSVDATTAYSAWQAAGGAPPGASRHPARPRTHHCARRGRDRSSCRWGGRQHRLRPPRAPTRPLLERSASAAATSRPSTLCMRPHRTPGSRTARPRPPGRSRAPSPLPAAGPHHQPQAGAHPMKRRLFRCCGYPPRTPHPRGPGRRRRLPRAARRP